MIISKNPDNSVFGHFHDLPVNSTREIHHRFEKHVHLSKCELLYFLQGKASFTIEGVTRELKPGDFAFVPRGKYHCIHVDKGIDYERVVMEFDFNSIPFSSSLDLDSLAGFYQASDVTITDYLYEIEQKIGVYSPEEFQAYFYATISKILYIFSSKEKNRNTRKEDLLSSIIAYLNDHVYVDIKMEDIAAQFSLPSASINRYFKSHMDVSLHQYIKNMKMQKAYNLLLSNKPSEEVAVTLGYQDYSTFYRSFVSTFSISPKQFKK